LPNNYEKAPFIFKGIKRWIDAAHKRFDVITFIKGDDGEILLSCVYESTDEPNYVTFELVNGYYTRHACDNEYLGLISDLLLYF